MAGIAAWPVQNCIAFTNNILAGFALLRLLSRMVQKRRQLNLNLCSVRRGPSPNRSIRCGVCWGDMDADDETILHQSCNNSWHRGCIEDIAKYEQHAQGWAPCPLCRLPLNAEPKIVRLFRALPSRVSLHGEPLNRLSRRAMWANFCFAVITLGVFLAGDRLVETSTKEPSLRLLIPPAFITMAVVLSATAVALEQLRFLTRMLQPQTFPFIEILTRLLINAVVLLVLTIAGRQLKVPAALSFDRLMTVGLRKNYAHIPNLPIMNWWELMGQWHEVGINLATTGMLCALVVLNRVLAIT